MTSHGSGKSHEYHRLTVISGSSRLTGIIKIPICHIYPCHHSGRYLYKTNYARQNKSKLYLHSLALSLVPCSEAPSAVWYSTLHPLTLKYMSKAGHNLMATDSEHQFTSQHLFFFIFRLIVKDRSYNLTGRNGLFCHIFHASLHNAMS